MERAQEGHEAVDDARDTGKKKPRREHSRLATVLPWARGGKRQQGSCQRGNRVRERHEVVGSQVGNHGHADTAGATRLDAVSGAERGRHS